MSITTKAILGFGITLIVAVAAIYLGNDRYDELEGAVTRACAGGAMSPQLENALFSLRARSDNGSDPVCAPSEKDDDIDVAAALLPHALTRR
ncbi:MAG: hypothetical protein JO042_15280 [Sinobacteraceae bacterium]|nr:hypothetical protein [Nevskiaceae bacterium]